jgi:Epoxide hydrolase N terminus
LRRTRLLEAETVTGPGETPDWNQGPPLGYVTDLVRYWIEDDWRRLERELDDHGSALTEIDGLDTAMAFTARQNGLPVAHLNQADVHEDFPFQSPGGDYHYENDARSLCREARLLRQPD